MSKIKITYLLIFSMLIALTHNAIPHQHTFEKEELHAHKHEHHHHHGHDAHSHQHHDKEDKDDTQNLPSHPYHFISTGEFSISDEYPLIENTNTLSFENLQSEISIIHIETTINNFFFDLNSIWKKEHYRDTYALRGPPQNLV